MKKVACAFLVLAGCAGSSTRAPVSEGERTYRTKCGSCHRLHQPAEFSRERWPAVVAEMERKKKIRLSPEQRALILGYLTGKSM